MSEMEKTFKVGEEVNLWIDIEKGGDPKGRRIIYGKASDESLDLDNQKVSSSAIAKSLAYFLRYGKIDYDHKSAKEGPKYIIGQPLEAEIKNKQFFVKAELFKGGVADEVWNIVSQGGKMGMSLTGKILGIKQEFDKSLSRTVDKINSLILTGIAVTAQPKNFNTYVLPISEFAKSLASAQEEVSDDVIEKAMATEGAGQVMVGQDLEPKVHVTTYGGEKKKRRKDAMKDIKKSLEDLSDGIGNLEKAIARFDDEHEEEAGTEGKGAEESAAAETTDDKGEKAEAPAAAAAPADDKGEKPAEEGKPAEPMAKSAAEEEEGEETGADDGKDDDGEEGEEEEGDDKKKKKVAKSLATEEPETPKKYAWEVTPVLKEIGEQMRQNADIQKSLLEANEVLVKANQKSMEMIKSLEAKVEALESQPTRLRKSIGSAAPLKKSAAENIEEATGGNATPDINTMRQEAISGKRSSMDVVRAELGNF